MIFSLFKKNIPNQEEDTPIEWRLRDENKDKLQIDEIEFVFQQAEQQLEGTIKEADTLLNRTSILLSVVLGFVASIIGFLITEIESEKPNYELSSTAILSIVYLIFPTFNLIKNFKGHKYKVSGSEPKLLLDEYYVIKYPDKDIRIVKMKLKEIISYQDRIEVNKKTNKLRWDIFNYSLKKMVYFPFILVSSYIIIKILSTLF